VVVALEPVMDDAHRPGVAPLVDVILPPQSTRRIKMMVLPSNEYPALQNSQSAATSPVGATQIATAGTNVLRSRTSISFMSVVTPQCFWGFFWQTCRNLVSNFVGLARSPSKIARNPPTTGHSRIRPPPPNQPLRLLVLVRSAASRS
jgi:hypothetical protein